MNPHKIPTAAIMLTALVLSAGCARVSAHVVEKPRVDQEPAGNAGYLKGAGSAPAAEHRKTRQMFQTEVELPTVQELNPWRVTKKPAVSAAAPASAPTYNWKSAPVESEQESAMEMREDDMKPATKRTAASTVKGGTTYTVQKGDTLEKIAVKTYGKSSKWKKIYDANRDVLKTPNRVYVGQKLTIPELESPAAESGDAQDFK